LIVLMIDVRSNQAARHMIRKTIYACRMYPIQREPMVSDFSFAAG